MNTMYAAAPPVKPFAVLFAPEFARGLHNPAFGRMPQRERKLPVGPSASDARWAAENLNTGGLTEEEAANELACRTMSAAEYAEFQAELSAMSLDRVESGEVAELRMTEADWDASIAQQAREWDSMHGYATANPARREVGVRVKPRRKRVNAAKARRMAATA